jgi:hypothetical protein
VDSSGRLGDARRGDAAEPHPLVHPARRVVAGADEHEVRPGLAGGRGQRVERGDLRYAVQRAAEEAEGKIKEAYNLALGIQGSSAAFRDVLFAAANAESDPFGSFTAADVAAAASLYAQTKLWGEQVAAVFAPDELQLLRVSNPYGPERGAVARMVEQAEERRPVVAFRGETRSWCWIDDVARALALTLARGGTALIADPGRVAAPAFV